MELHKLIEQVERVSQNYARKFGIRREKNWYMLKLQEEVGELTQSYLMMMGKARKKDKNAKQIKKEFQEEVIDVLCHTLLLAKHHGVDIKKTLQEKWLQWEK